MRKLFLIGVMAAGCASRGSSPDEQFASVNFIDAAGRPAGTALLYNTEKGVQVTANLPGLPGGEHGFHFHMVGQCTPPDFTSAGAHFNPTAKQHGRQNPAGPHLGDLPNVNRNPMIVSAEGVVVSGANGLLDADGAALVVHANADDQRTDPSGNSGARIRCGVINRR